MKLEFCIILKLFLNFRDFELQHSYRLCLIKKSVTEYLSCTHAILEEKVCKKSDN